MCRSSYGVLDVPQQVVLEPRRATCTSERIMDMMCWTVVRSEHWATACTAAQMRRPHP